MLRKLYKSYCAAHLLCRVLAPRSPIYLICLATRSRGFAHLGLLATLLQSFPNVYDAIPAAKRSRMLISNPYANQLTYAG